MRYSDAKKHGTALLKSAGIEEAEVDAEYLLLNASGLERSGLFVKLFEEMPEDIALKYEELLKKRSSHEPLQYILGSQEFMGYDFIVTGDVLIPRFDTEILAELAIKRSLEDIRSLKTKDNTYRILDLCTGSGCVAVSVGLGTEKELKKERNVSVVLDVTAGDISDAAVALAQKNLKLNKKETDSGIFKFAVSDLFKEIPGSFNLITANPPYIVRNEIAELMPEIREHEPHLALDGGDDGMDFYRKICAEAPGHLYKNGRLLMEFDDSQAEPVKEMMEREGFGEIHIHRDLAGLRRVIEGVLIGEQKCLES